MPDKPTPTEFVDKLIEIYNSDSIDEQWKIFMYPDHSKTPMLLPRYREKLDVVRTRGICEITHLHFECGLFRSTQLFKTMYNLATNRTSTVSDSSYQWRNKTERALVVRRLFLKKLKAELENPEKYNRLQTEINYYL